MVFWAIEKGIRFFYRRGRRGRREEREEYLYYVFDEMSEEMLGFMSESISIKQLFAQWITSENFRSYGQVISSSFDGKFFDAEDARLNLQNGIPRFYIMRLHEKGRKFGKITRHVKCTQCLGSLEGKDWLMAVAPPGDSDKPTLEDIVAFRIPGNCFIKLETGTWHAGPYFDADFVDFYNLELSDTNIVDHFSHDFVISHNLEFEIV